MYYNDEFKRNVVNRYIIGDSVPKIHKDTGVSKSTINGLTHQKSAFQLQLCKRQLIGKGKKSVGLKI